MSNNAVGFFKEVGNEMKKVSWPDKTQLQEATIVTIVFCFIVTVYTFVIDFVFQSAVDVLFSL